MRGLLIVAGVLLVIGAGLFTALRLTVRALINE